MLILSNQLTKHVIGASFQVYNTLGFGFLESVYENALSIELSELGLSHTKQAPIQVNYGGRIVGDFIADVLVETKLVVELKSVTQLTVAHEVQVANYLAATDIETGLLINFGPEKVEIKRKHRTYRTPKPKDQPRST